MFKFLSVWGALLYIPPKSYFTMLNSEILRLPVLHFFLSEHIIYPLYIGKTPKG